MPPLSVLVLVSIGTLLSTAAATRPNAPCKENRDCRTFHTYLICHPHNSSCVCPIWNPNWHMPSNACEEPYESQPCFGDRDIDDEERASARESEFSEVCHGIELVCDDTYTCRCPFDSPEWNAEERDCDKRGLGGPCDADAQCHHTTRCDTDSKTCICRLPQYPLPDTVSKTCSEKYKYGQHCPTNDCEHGDLECLNGICLCRDTSLEFIIGACRSRAKKTFDAPCSGADVCNSERGLVCEKGKCNCGEGAMWIQNLCQMMPQKCAAGNTQTVCNASKGLHCDASMGECACPMGQELSSTSSTCKLMGTEVCLENGALVHDRCASGVCLGADVNPATVAERCSCDKIHGLSVNSTWSAEGDISCIPDYFGLPCNPTNGDGDCRLMGKRTNGLSCLEGNGGWTCACAEGRSHFHGFCVVANASHGERCDPKGEEPTCNLDQSVGLVCDQEGPGYIRYLCRCRQTAVTAVDGTVTYSPLTWNQDSKQCEAKRVGEICHVNEECTSGVCKVPNGAPWGKCTNQAAGGGGVIRSQIPALLIVAAITCTV